MKKMALVLTVIQLAAMFLGAGLMFLLMLGAGIFFEDFLGIAIMGDEAFDIYLNIIYVISVLGALFLTNLFFFKLELIESQFRSYKGK